MVAQFRRLIVVNLQQELSLRVHWRWHAIVSASSISGTTTSPSTLGSLLHVIITVVVTYCVRRGILFTTATVPGISLAVPKASLAVHVVVVIVVVIAGGHRTGGC